MSSNTNNAIVLYEERNTLVVKEWINGALVPVMQVARGAATQAQLAYYRANLIGKIKQEEADLVLKYFYNIDVE